MTKHSSTLLAWAVGLALAIPTALSGQQQERPQPRIDPYVVGEAVPPVEEGATVVEMSLEEAIETALESNLSLQSARLNPRIQDLALRSSRAAFDPTLSTNYSYNNSTNQSTSQLDGGTRTVSQRHSLSASLAQTLPWYGGRLSASFNNSRNATNSQFSTRNPSYSSSLSLSYSQPLLAGREIDNQRASLETQQIQSEITELQLASQIQTLSNQVRQAYWALRSSIEQIEIQRRNLAEAQELLAQNQLRLQQGGMTQIQMAQAEAQVANGEQSLLNARITWRNREFAFKTLLLGGAEDPLLYQTVNPTTLPTPVQPEVDIEAAVEVALSQRADIRQQRWQQDISDINLEVTESGALPDLSLSAGYSLSGVGGNLFERGELGGEPVLVREGGWFDGVQSIAGFDTPTWNVGLSASYPLGIDPSKVSLERARLQLRQAELNLRSQELAIVTQVTNAGLALQNTFLQLEAARRSREAAERSAEAEMLRFEVGLATNFEVVTAQDALTSSRLSELQAIINHVNAVAEFERVQTVGG